MGRPVKLTRFDVDEIRRMIDDKNERWNFRMVARMFKVSQMTVMNAYYRRGAYAPKPEDQVLDIYLAALHRIRKGIVGTKSDMSDLRPILADEMQQIAADAIVRAQYIIDNKDTHV